MPDIKFYLDDKHYHTYKGLDNDSKKAAMAKARRVLYRELDKV